MREWISPAASRIAFTVTASSFFFWIVGSFMRDGCWYLIVGRWIAVPRAETGQVDLVPVQHLVQLAAVLSGLLGRAADVPADALQQGFQVLSRPALPRLAQMRDHPAEGGLELVAFLLEDQIVGADRIPCRQ